MKFSALILPIIFFCACATPLLAPDYIANLGRDYTIITVDDPVGQKFLITVKSKSENDICLYDGTWPNPYVYRNSPNRGELISQLDADISVSSRTASYQPRTPNVGGHCGAETVEQMQKNCSERLKAGQSMTTELPYAFFGTDILQDSDTEKKLKYSASLPFCDMFAD